MRLLPQVEPERPTFKHGTNGGYTNHKCRCVPCTDAYAAYKRDHRAAYARPLDPPPGHRLADIQINMETSERRAVCQCGQVFAWFVEPVDACEPWRVHAGVA